MSRSRSKPIAPRDLPYILFSRAAIPAVVAAGCCVVVAAVWLGWAGLVGSLVGAAIVVGFYVADLLTLRLAEMVDGQALMPLMLTQYMIKVIVLAMLLVILWDTTAFDMEAMAVTVAIATIVWTVALAVTAARAATFVVDVTSEGSTSDS